MKNYFIKIFLIFSFIINLSILPSFANGGIPLWIMTTPTVLSLGLPAIPFALILILIVALVETIVAKFILKEITFLKLYIIIFGANTVSTLIGSLVVLFPYLFNKDYDIFLGPWGFWGGISILIMNILLFLISYFSEFLFSKKYFIKLYDINIIKKAFLFGNLTTYALPFIAYSVLAFFSIQHYATEFVYSKHSIHTIENMQITKNAFIPKPINKAECKQLKEPLGIKADCTQDEDYWAGAVVECGGVEHLPSIYQLDNIAKRIYKTNNIQKKSNKLKYNANVAEVYGIPKSISEKKYNSNDAHYFYINVWTNRTGDTTSEPYYYSFGSNDTNSNILRSGANDVYAICINNNVRQKQRKVLPIK